MKIRGLSILIVPLLALGAVACEVEQERPGQPPHVDVEPGQMPEYDVRTPELEMQRDTQVIITPDPQLRPPSEQPN